MALPAVSASLPLPTLSVMMPPELAVEPSPATVRLPVAAVVLFQRMPLAPPLAEIEVKLNAPSELLKLSAVALVVVTLTSPTLRLVAVLAVNPAVPDAGVMFSPFTTSLVAMTTLPCTDGRVPPIDGRAMVPVGGVMLNTESKLLPLTPWPISHSLEFKVMPAVSVPL